MKHHAHRGADKVRFSTADARRAREDVARQDAQERAYQRLWIRFLRQRNVERGAGGGIEVETRTRAAA